MPVFLFLPVTMRQFSLLFNLYLYICTVILFVHWRCCISVVFVFEIKDCSGLCTVISASNSKLVELSWKITQDGVNIIYKCAHWSA